MAVSIDNLGGIQRKVELVVSAQSIRQEVQKRLQELVGKVRIDGFRRGKVPIKIIQERYGDSVYSEALNELINTVYSTALKESNVAPAGPPKVTPVDETFKKDEDFKFTAVFDVYPEIDLQPFSAITVEKCIATLEESDVAKAIERLREQRGTERDNGEKQLPELNDEFVASLGVKGGLDDLTAEVRKNLERELKYALKNKLKANVIEQLISAHPFDIPDALVMQEAERLRENSKRYFKQMASKISFPELSLDLFKEKALENVRVGLLFSDMLEKLKIEATQDKIDERVRDMATMYDDSEQAIQWISHDKRQMENIRAQVLEDTLIEKVLEEANIVEKTVTYEELIQQARS